MKKLLFITWSISYGYGTEKSLADILNRMDQTQYAISVLPLFKYADQSIFNPSIKILDALLDYTGADFDKQKALDRYYALLADPMRFNRMIKEKYDCVIACNHNAPSYFASYIKGIPKVLWIRGDMRELDYTQYEQGSSQYKRIKQEYEMQANVLQCFDAIAVISDVVQNALEKLFGITANVVKISNSVDSEKIKMLSEEPVDLPETMLFTTLGRLDANKNQMLLLKAAREVKKQRDDFMIYILGEGEQRANLERYIEENALDNNVRILGFVENPYPYIKHSAATILTSLSEGFSLVLVESAILKTPVISTDVGVARELVEKYNCGDLIQYDERELAFVMLGYLNNYGEYDYVFDLDNEYDVKTEAEKTVALIEKTMRACAHTAKIKKLPYPEVNISAQALDDYCIEMDKMYVLRVIKDDVPYEYLIHRRSDNDKLIVFNNGAVAQGNVTVPVFQRHSWAELLKTSAVFCMDPTLYLNGYLQVGWGMGKNENYYLENSSLLLKKIIAKMQIDLKNTVIFGTSAGGYLSILMGIYLRGAKVVADNAQLDLRNWIFKDALDCVLSFSFDHISTSLRYKERFSVVEAFLKHQYMPKLYLHVNLCSVADNTTQLIPFLRDAQALHGIKAYQDIEVCLHCSLEKGHDGIDMQEAIAFLYKVLDEPCRKEG